MQDIRYRLLDNNGNLIFCCLHDSEISMLDNIEEGSKKTKDQRKRTGLKESESGKVYAFTSSTEYIKSSRKFKTILQALLDSLSITKSAIKSAQEKNNRQTSRLIHNLISLNAHNIQEFYSLVPQDSVSKKMGEQINFVSEIAQKEPRETALTLLRMAKNNTAIKTEFSVFNKLFESNPNLRIQNHNVHKVLMNVFYLFFPDFTDKDVKVKISKSKETAIFDYESFHVALYHLIENTAKYIKPFTDLIVEIKKTLKGVAVTLDMTSTEIQDKEKKLIFDEGFSGNLSHRTGKAGDGIGMSMVKKIMNINNGSISLTTFRETLEVTRGVPYQRNLFEILLPVR